MRHDFRDLHDRNGRSRAAAACAGEGYAIVRAELCDRLDSLKRASDRMTVRDMLQRIGSLRTMAAAYDMVPVVCLADALERAIRAEPRGCPAGLYLERLRDAIGCARQDEEAGAVLLASVGVRLGG